MKLSKTELLKKYGIVIALSECTESEELLQTFSPVGFIRSETGKSCKVYPVIIDNRITNMVICCGSLIVGNVKPHYSILDEFAKIVKEAKLDFYTGLITYDEYKKYAQTFL